MPLNAFSTINHMLPKWSDVQLIFGSCHYSIQRVLSHAGRQMNARARRWQEISLRTTVKIIKVCSSIRQLCAVFFCAKKERWCDEKATGPERLCYLYEFPIFLGYQFACCARKLHSQTFSPPLRSQTSLLPLLLWKYIMFKWNSN